MAPAAAAPMYSESRGKSRLWITVMSTSQKSTVATCLTEAAPTSPAEAVAAAKVGSRTLLN